MNDQKPIDYGQSAEDGSNKRQAREIDTHIGKRLKKFRQLRSLTQEDLAQKLDVSFQQIQKYENGKSRIPFARAFELCEFLGIDMDDFFEGFGQSVRRQRLSDTAQRKIDQQSESKKQTRKDIEELQKAYFLIENGERRSNFVKLIKEMAKTMKDK